MARTAEMFVKPRRPRRVLMHWTDAGQGMTHFVCRCGYSAWLAATDREMKRGVPCPKCNQDQPREKHE